MSDNGPFERELATLLEAPYSYIHVVTHDEARAVALVTRVALAAGRPVHEWSATRGMPMVESRGVGADDIDGLLDAIEGETQNAIFILKDAHPHLQNPLLVRRLREMEPLVAAFGKSVVLISPMAFTLEDLATDVTELRLPMPARAELLDVARIVFPLDRWPDIDREGLVTAALGLTSRQALRAFHRARLEALRAFKENDAAAFAMDRVVLDEKRRVVARTDVVEFVEARQALDDVGGMELLKDWLHARRDAFSERARAFGLPAPRGLLLLGVQGCGKSLMAKVVSRHWGLPLLRLDIGALFAGRQAPELAMRQALAIAEAVSPAVLWVDEIEKAFDRDAGSGSHRLLGGLLTWLQEKRAPVFFVATANRVDGLPPELLRKGRFDEIFFVDLPDTASRQEILSIHLVGRDRNPRHYDIPALATAAHNFSGAELEQVVVSGLYLAFGHGRGMTQDDLLQAVQQTVPLARTCEEEIKELRVWARDRARFATRDATEMSYFGGLLKEPRQS